MRASADSRVVLRVCLPAVILLALFSASTYAQGAGAYPAIVHAYRSFDPDAVARLRALATDAIEEAVSEATDGKPQRWTWADLRGAGMLHTEAWYLARAEGAADEAARHLLLAEQLLGAVTLLEPQQRYFVERWCQTLPVILRKDGRTRPGTSERVAQTLHDRCRRRWPLSLTASNASARYDLALFNEWTFFGPDSPGVKRTSDPWVQQRMRGFARMYEAALAEDRDYPEAALRLGNLRAGLGEEALALEHFTVASRAADPRIRYLAFLFVGEIHNRNGRLDAAERFYRAAIAQYPAAPSAVYALSELLGRRGRDIESKQRLLELLRQGRHVDPLWTFRLPPGQNASLQLDELRIEVMQ
jgi:tetratricopeptide (TPR) repeat protein